MPVHDWSRVEDGIFHDFHVSWIPELRKALNGGILPEGYYALAEQHAGQTIADLLTLHASSEEIDPTARTVPPPAGGGAVALEAPQVSKRDTIEGSLLARQRSLAIRHVSGHRLIALLEIVSAANKDRRSTVEDFAAKVSSALHHGVHVLIVDLFPPGKFDPQGIHGVIRQQMMGSDKPYDLPAAEPLTLASYAAGPRVEVYLEHLAPGNALPQMPLFLSRDRYVKVPLESTYQEAYAGMPAFWRGVIEGRK